MSSDETKIAFAALDIGTSQIKLGVYFPFLSPVIILLGSVENDLIYGRSGEVRADYQMIRDKSFFLLKELGHFVKKEKVTTLYLGICGHVSSLLEWDKSNGIPAEEPFPIWLDTTSRHCLDEYNQVMGNGKSNRIIGTFLPSGTNWLFTKLLQKKKSGFPDDSIYLQVGDALYYELCGEYKTHFSSQISMVNLKKRAYAEELLEHLQLNTSSLPFIDSGPTLVSKSQREFFNFPEQTFVFPAMADLYTSLYGLRLHDKEGFMLANTSEQAGAFYLQQPNAVENFLSISFNEGFINYGSTNTGANIVNWFLTNVLNKKVTAQTLHELTTRAEAIHPGDTPIVLPYLQGERAPLWNSSLTASIHELTASHTEVHLFRAILESISFARRQCFEQLGLDTLDLIKIGGGSSKNALWNTIRATVLNKAVAVADEKELSMAGIINYVMEAKANSFIKPAINFSRIKPALALVGIYQEKYRKFIRYQNLTG
jgi:sugar (pentulose or hexulose) kinase